MIKKIMLIGLSVFILHSCSSKVSLSESEALTILRQDYKGDCYSFIFDRMNDWKSNKNYVDTFYALEAKKLVTLSRKETFIHGNSTGYVLSWKPTEDGLKYKSKKSKQYKLTELIVKDIVGISINQEEKTAMVRFSYEVVETPFKKVQSRSYKNCKSSTGEYEVEFIHYDTGWKIKEIINLYLNGHVKFKNIIS